MMGHCPISEHPEVPQRIAQIVDILTINNVIPNMVRIPLRAVEKQEVLLVHSEDHWEKVEAIQCEPWILNLPETWLNPTVCPQI